jgi:type VI secretion system secreted protein VgrG
MTFTETPTITPTPTPTVTETLTNTPTDTPTETPTTTETVDDLYWEDGNIDPTQPIIGNKTFQRNVRNSRRRSF